MSPHERTVQVSRPIMPKRTLREHCRQPFPNRVRVARDPIGIQAVNDNLGLEDVGIRFTIKVAA
jgi:hypothetical protein